MKLIILYYTSPKNLIETKSEDAMKRLYELEAQLPTEEQVKEYIKKNKKNKDKIILFFEKYTIIRGIKIIKKRLSNLDNYIPLYDIYSQNLYIIPNYDVYTRIIKYNYRFPTEELYMKLLKQKKELDVIKNDDMDVLTKRKYVKLTLALDFLKYFDLDILFKTYTSMIYLHTENIGKNITTCMKPSFISHYSHLEPYYTRSEIINMVLNLGVKLEEDKYYDTTDINKLCKIIMTNDITSKILLEHHNYIINNNRVGLVQYYTLQGSTYINKYLRKLISYEYKNRVLESIIYPMWELINSAPEFDKKYTLYRFIPDDSFLRNLNIGDIHTEQGFMSTTRDPFFRSSIYKFGFVLLKINIPAKMKGVALCVETISHFNHEQEIILAPESMFRLDKKDEKIIYYHTDEKFNSLIKIRYEFTYIGKKPVSQIDRPLYLEERPHINFLKLESPNTISLEEKIRFFYKQCLNQMFQYDVVIGNRKYTIVTERYDSTETYKKFYALESNNGLLFYTIYDNYMLFMIEIGEEKNGNRSMYVNYRAKYSMLDITEIIGNENFITFISSVAYYFNIPLVLIFAEYKACEEIRMKISKEKKTDPKEENYMGGSYCYDYYIYLKNNIKKYEKNKFLNVELRPKFSYYQLDKIRTIDYTEALRKNDPDKLFHIYEKIYMPTDPKHNLAGFYIWIIENKCYLTKLLIEKFTRIYKVDNPFVYDYYILDPSTFLYNRKHIDTYPQNITSNIVNYKSKNYNQILVDNPLNPRLLK